MIMEGYGRLNFPKVENINIDDNEDVQSGAVEEVAIGQDLGKPSEGAPQALT